MTTADVLTIMKQFIGQAVAEVGGESPEYLDNFLLEYVKTANFLLSVRGLTTNVEVDPTAKTITPDPTTTIGSLLAIKAAANLISDDLLLRLRQGEMGVSFKTSITQITSNEAARVLKASSNTLDNTFERLLTAYMSIDPRDYNVRVQ